MNAGAYMAEIFRAGIQSVDKGQMEAARSLGLSYGKAMQKVVLPQAIRTMVPSIINQFIILPLRQFAVQFREFLTDTLHRRILVHNADINIISICFI